PKLPQLPVVPRPEDLFEHCPNHDNDRKWTGNLRDAALKVNFHPASRSRDPPSANAFRRCINDSLSGTKETNLKRSGTATLIAAPHRPSHDQAHRKLHRPVKTALNPPDRRTSLNTSTGKLRLP